MEKGRNILLKAIGELPDFRCDDDDLWSRIENNIDTKDEINVSELRGRMPEYDAPKGIWKNIESTLNKMSYENAIGCLPEHPLPIDIWPGIEKELNKTKKVKPKKIYLSLLKVAAILIVVVGSSLAIRAIINQNEKRGTISYSVEMIDVGEISNEVNSPGLDKDEHIQTICRNNPIVCSTPQFVELNSQIEDVDKELENIATFLKKDNDPQLQRYYYQLENEKLSIEKKIIKMINES